MATEIWVNIGSGNAVRQQAITWTNVDFSSFKSSDIHIRAISQEMPQPSITKIRLKITCLKFYWNSPGANELSLPGSVINGPVSQAFPVWLDCLMAQRRAAWFTGFNTLRPVKNGQHFADYIFKFILLNENFEFQIKFDWNLFLIWK